MEVICKGYKICKNNTWCHHAKPHKYDEVSENYCYNKEDEIIDCCCNNKSLREYKLEKLNKINDSI